MDRCDLDKIKRNIENCIGEKIQLKANKGRRKSYVKEGVLENTYPSIFTVKFENECDSSRRDSYSYIDIMTKAVEIVRCRDNKRIQVG